MTSGLMIGRFMPPHDGHVLLAETALGLCDRLTIMVCHQPDDPLPPALRIGWLREMFPAARLVDCAMPMPDAGAAPDAWRDAVAALHPQPVDLLFTSDAHAGPLAAALGARPILVDPERIVVPVTARAIRADPFAHWRHIPPPVRPYYARTICLHGPESTGKSTLAKRLAAHFDTMVLPEYGRTYCDYYGLALSMRDLLAIGRTHAAMTRAALRQCNRRLILDTDPLMTAAWADMLFDRRDPWFDAFDETADLYLLLDIDIPWVDDGTRFFGDDGRRRQFFALSRAELDRRGLPYAVIGGTAEERFDRAIAAIAAAGC